MGSGVFEILTNSKYKSGVVGARCCLLFTLKIQLFCTLASPSTPVHGMKGWIDPNHPVVFRSIRLRSHSWCSHWTPSDCSVASRRSLRCVPSYLVECELGLTMKKRFNPSPPPPPLQLWSVKPNTKCMLVLQKVSEHMYVQPHLYSFL